VRSSSMAHWLSAPHSGQRWGVGGVGEGLDCMAFAV
jgi:hypothetical protein